MVAGASLRHTFVQSVDQSLRHRPYLPLTHATALCHTTCSPTHPDLSLRYLRHSPDLRVTPENHTKTTTLRKQIPNPSNISPPPLLHQFAVVDLLFASTQPLNRLLIDREIHQLPTQPSSFPPSEWPTIHPETQRLVTFQIFEVTRDPRNLLEYFRPT